MQHLKYLLYIFLLILAYSILWWTTQTGISASAIYLCLKKKKIRMAKGAKYGKALLFKHWHRLLKARRQECETPNFTKSCGPCSSDELTSLVLDFFCFFWWDRYKSDPNALSMGLICCFWVQLSSLWRIIGRVPFLGFPLGTRIRTFETSRCGTKLVIGPP